MTSTTGPHRIYPGGWVDFDHAPQGAPITFTSRGRVRAGRIATITDRSVSVLCDDDTRARLTRARWQDHVVVLGDRARRERLEAGEALGYGATPAHETHTLVRDLVASLASLSMLGVALASVPQDWDEVAGVDGVLVQWWHDGTALVYLVADGANAVFVGPRRHDPAGSAHLEMIANALRTQGWGATKEGIEGYTMSLTVAPRTW